MRPKIKHCTCNEIGVSRLTAVIASIFSSAGQPFEKVKSFQDEVDFPQATLGLRFVFYSSISNRAKSNYRNKKNSYNRSSPYNKYNNGQFYCDIIETGFQSTPIREQQCPETINTETTYVTSKPWNHPFINNTAYYVNNIGVG
uniref:Uncharacterized protein LOC111120470 n=1 Tax=Crassostrea virginica TaxID=6565 RepID=A0A8B8CM17_CRAVI|nr:uncharacterized protein LOC111120470 [Crassostrea virginica]